MFGDGSLTFREFATREPFPLAMIHDAVLDFLRGRDDAALCGAQAVNAYVDEPRMTQDVDILSPRAAELTADVRAHLERQFNIVLETRVTREKLDYRIDQVREPENRHLVDVRSVNSLPPNQLVEEVHVLSPQELIASKVLRMVSRWRGTKRFLDMADLYRLLLTFPELKTGEGQVAERLRAAGATDAVMTAWKDLVSQEILPDDEDAGF